MASEKTELYFQGIEGKYKLFEYIGYKPHAGQKVFHNSFARFKTLRCGARFGKTMAGPLDLMPVFCTPGTRIWIVAQNYVLGEKEWRVFFDAVFGGSMFPKTKIKSCIKKIVQKSNNPSQGQMSLKITWIWDPAFVFPEKELTPQPSELYVRSAENEDGLLGEELDGLLLAEGAKIKKYIYDRYLNLRMVSREGVVLIPSTSSDNSELQDEFYDKGQDPMYPDYASWEFPSFVNPYWAPDIEAEKERLKKELPREAYEEQVLGKKVHYSGRYYKEFDYEIHIKELEYNNSDVCYRSWDFGFRHPCILWAQVNKDDQLLLLYGYLGSDIDDTDLVWIGLYLSNELSVDNLQRIYRTKEEFGHTVREYMPPKIYEYIRKKNLLPFFNDRLDFHDYCDAFGGNQVKSSSGSSIKVMQSFGLHPKYKFEKTQGDEREPPSVSIIREELKLRSDNKPNCYIDKDNVLVINMFRNLAYEDRKDGIKPIKYKKEGKEEHPHDCLRYLCMHLRKHLLYKLKERNKTRYAYSY